MGPLTAAPSDSGRAGTGGNRKVKPLSQERGVAGALATGSSDPSPAGETAESGELHSWHRAAIGTTKLQAGHSTCYGSLAGIVALSAREARRSPLPRRERHFTSRCRDTRKSILL